MSKQEEERLIPTTPPWTGGVTSLPEGYSPPMYAVPSIPHLQQTGDQQPMQIPYVYFVADNSQQLQHEAIPLIPLVPTAEQDKVPVEVNTTAQDSSVKVLPHAVPKSRCRKGKSAALCLCFLLVLVFLVTSVMRLGGGHMGDRDGHHGKHGGGWRHDDDDDNNNDNSGDQIWFTPNIRVVQGNTQNEQNRQIDYVVYQDKYDIYVRTLDSTAQFVGQAQSVTGVSSLAPVQSYSKHKVSREAVTLVDAEMLNNTLYILYTKGQSFFLTQVTCRYYEMDWNLYNNEQTCLATPVSLPGLYLGEAPEMSWKFLKFDDNDVWLQGVYQQIMYANANANANANAVKRDTSSNYNYDTIQFWSLVNGTVSLIKSQDASSYIQPGTSLPHGNMNGQYVVVTPYTNADDLTSISISWQMCDIPSATCTVAPWANNSTYFTVSVVDNNSGNLLLCSRDSAYWWVTAESHMQQLTPENAEYNWAYMHCGFVAKDCRQPVYDDTNHVVQCLSAPVSYQERAMLRLGQDSQVEVLMKTDTTNVARNQICSIGMVTFGNGSGSAASNVNAHSFDSFLVCNSRPRHRRHHNNDNNYKNY